MIFWGKEENPVVCLDVFIVLFLYLYLSKCLCICTDNLDFRIEETRWKPVVVLVAALVCLDVLLHLLLLLFLGDATIRQIYCLISRQFTLFGLFLFNCPPFVCTLLRWRESVWTLNAGVSHIAPTTTTLELCSIKWCETSNVWWIWVVLEKDDLNPPQKWPEPEPKNDLAGNTGDLTVSPAWSVFHPGVKLHQDKDLQTAKHVKGWEYQPTWSVGRRLKSFGGFVITYLFPGASGPALLSRNLSENWSLFLLCYRLFRLFRFPHIIQLDFCVANYLVMKIL